MNKCIYTVNLGGYEELQQAPRYSDWDTIAFVDFFPEDNKGWDIRYFPIQRQLGCVRSSRLPRILPHKYLQDYDVSIYIDSSVKLRISPDYWPAFKNQDKWAACRHWCRDTVWPEFTANHVCEKMHPETGFAQEKDYKDRGLHNIPLLQNCVIYRQHNDPDVIHTCEEWWKEFNTGTCRDQLSLPMALYTTKLVPTELCSKPKSGTRNSLWEVQHIGKHKDYYKSIDLYIVVCNYRGSAISRGVQMSKILFDRGIRNKLIQPSWINNIPDGSTVIFVKEYRTKEMQVLKEKNCKIIYDIVDNQPIWHKGVDCNLIDGVVYPNIELLQKWADNNCVPAHNIVLEHHGDVRFKKNTASDFSAVCISTPTQIPNCVFNMDIDILTEPWEDLFKRAPDYNLHVAVYKDGIDYKYKPSSHLVTACACGANVILQRKFSNLKILDPQYPYYVNSELDIPDMFLKAKEDYEKYKNGEESDWGKGLKMIEDSAQKVNAERIGSKYEEYLGLVKDGLDVTRYKYNNKPHAVVVGAGLSGLTAAHILQERGYTVQIFEKRDYIGGSCAVDEDNSSRFGAHIFHTNNRSIFDFINKHTDIYPYEHKVVAHTDLGFIPIPYNIVSELITGKLTDDEILRLVVHNYSYRQWGERTPLEALRRLQIRRDSTDVRYFTDKYQCIPDYNMLFKTLSKDINIKYNCKKEDWENEKCDVLIYTGSIDEYYNYTYGVLQYRTIDFKAPAIKTNCAVLNNCGLNMHTTHTRTINHKYIPGTGDLTYSEYPRDYVVGSDDLRLYPVADSIPLAELYRSIPSKAIFLGRQGRFKYINMDEAMLKAILVASSI